MLRLKFTGAKKYLLLTQFYMKKIVTLIIVLCCYYSCGDTHQKINKNNSAKTPAYYFDIITDTTSTRTQILESATEFIDSISLWARDEHNLKNRIAAQQFGYMTIDALLEISYENKRVQIDDISPLFNRIIEALDVWLVSNDNQLPHLWKDLYYVSHKASDNPTEGYFHIMVTIPTKERPDPTLEIFYPEGAVDKPVVVFSKFLNENSIEEDYNNQEVIPLENWVMNNKDNDSIMHATGDHSIVEKMLKYDVMYLQFLSGVSPDGDPSETEIARLSLAPFQKQWESALRLN